MKWNAAADLNVRITFGNHDYGYLCGPIRKVCWNSESTWMLLFRAGVWSKFTLHTCVKNVHFCWNLVASHWFIAMQHTIKFILKSNTQKGRTRDRKRERERYTSKKKNCNWNASISAFDEAKMSTISNNFHKLFRIGVIAFCTSQGDLHRCFILLRQVIILCTLQR